MSASSPRLAYYAGVDLGGTKIMTGIFNEDLELTGIAKITTKAHRGPEAVIDRMIRCIDDALDECDLKRQDLRAVGVGAPGAVDPQKGRVIFAPNLAWKNVGLKSALQEKLKVPVAIENDCNLSTLGIHVREFEAKPRHMVGIFIGTGIGGGIVVDGEIYSGFNRAAGEIGHMVIDLSGPECGCGNRGCFEALCSRTALHRQIRQAVKEGEATLLTDLLGPDLENLRSRALRKALRRGDKLVANIIKQASVNTGIAVGNLLNLLNPEVIVLGGGIIEALEEEMLPVISERARQQALAGTAAGVEITASQLADNAGIFGGGVLAEREARKA